MFPIPVGYYSGCPVSRVDVQTSQAIMGERTLFYQEAKAQAQSQGLSKHRAPQSIFPCAWQPFSHLDLYHL